MSDEKQTTGNDRMERLLFGGAIIGSNTLAMGLLSFFNIPEGNATVVGQIAGGLSAALGIIAANTWKTSLTERQQAQTLQTLAASSAAPLTTTTTTTVEKADGQNGQGTVRNPTAGAGPDVTGDDGVGLAGERPPVAGRPDIDTPDAAAVRFGASSPR